MFISKIRTPKLQGVISAIFSVLLRNSGNLFEAL